MTKKTRLPEADFRMKKKRRREADPHPAAKELPRDSVPSDEDAPADVGAKIKMASEGTSRSDMFSEGRFHDLGLAETVADHLHGRMGFTSPTHIQREAIPVILSGKDVLLNAGTGTGKTLVYLAPIVSALQGSKKQINRTDGTYCLVLVPTRELCVQVSLLAQKLVHRFIWLVPGCLMGGENRAKEKARLRKGVTILIATPGRLLDHLKTTESFKLNNLRWLVLDEADRLLDMGFEKDVQSILTLLGSRQSASTSGNAVISPAGQQRNWTRQHVLLSATLDEHVNQLAELSLRQPVLVGIPSRDSSAQVELKGKGRGSNERESDGNEIPEKKPIDYSVPSKLEQSYYKVPSKLRLIALLALLLQRSRSPSTAKLVVFFSTCDAVDFHYSLLQDFRLPHPASQKGSPDEGPFLKPALFRLHGNMLPKERTETFMQFDKISEALLLCTDVASRGLDFKGVTCIVQYDPPGDAAEYVHRVGRTARLGQEGEAFLFLQPSEVDYLTSLQKHGVTLKNLALAKLLDILPTDRKRKQSQDFTAIETSHPVVSYMHLALETFVSKKNRNALAAKAFGSYIRAYAAYKAELKPIFRVHKLHLGHVAKSFGLNTPPSDLGKMGKRAPPSRAQKLQNNAKDERNNDRKKKQRRLVAGSMQE